MAREGDFSPHFGHYLTQGLLSHYGIKDPVFMLKSCWNRQADKPQNR
jgi:hypothetical protein